MGYVYYSVKTFVNYSTFSVKLNYFFFRVFQKNELQKYEYRDKIELRFCQDRGYYNSESERLQSFKTHEAEIEDLLIVSCCIQNLLVR